MSDKVWQIKPGNQNYFLLGHWVGIGIAK